MTMIKTQFRQRFLSLFYPVGKYHKSYTRFAGWSFLSNVLVSAESVIATHNMLATIDINSTTDSVRTFNYIGKDIIGQIGGLYYMSKIGDKTDKEPKTILLYSNCIQQISYTAVCMTPYFPNYFLPVAGMSNIFSNICFTGFGAVNAQCIQKLAIDNNIGEIYAKIGIICTTGSSIGLILGLSIIAKIPDNSSQLSILPLIAASRIYTINKAVSSVLE